MTEEKTPIVPENVIRYVSELIQMEKDVKAKLDEAKKGLRMAMEQHGVKTVDFGVFRATIAADSEKTLFDTARLRKEHPEIYKQYATMKTQKGGFILK